MDQSLVKTATTRKERWVGKHFKQPWRGTPTTHDVLRALDRFERRDRELAQKEQPRLGISILRAYLKADNVEPLKAVCKRFPGTKEEHALAVRRIITILNGWKRRYVWGQY